MQTLRIKLSTYYNQKPPATNLLLFISLWWRRSNILRAQVKLSCKEPSALNLSLQRSLWWRKWRRASSFDLQAVYLVNEDLIYTWWTGIDESPKSKIERRKRNLKFLSWISWRERENWYSYLESEINLKFLSQVREQKYKFTKKMYL